MAVVAIMAMINDMKFSEQGEAWFEGLRTRKRKPIKPGSLVVYRSYLRNHIIPLLGDIDIATFGNAGMRTFAASLVASDRKLGPKSMNEIAAAVKQIVSSAVNENGDQLYPRAWNSAFIDLPQVNKKDQKSPTIDAKEVTQVIKRSRPAYGAFYAMLAGTGLRIGEALAVRIGDDGAHSGWDPEKRLISVRTQFWRGQEISPKTSAGIREVDMHPRLNQVLADHAGTRAPGSFLFESETKSHMHESTLRKFSLKKLNVPGFHVFRRFRITRLRETGCPEDIVRYWAGHEGEGITDRYSKLSENKELRKGWAERCGLGFEIDIRESRTANEGDGNEKG